MSSLPQPAGQRREWRWNLHTNTMSICLKGLSTLLCGGLLAACQATAQPDTDAPIVFDETGPVAEAEPTAVRWTRFEDWLRAFRVQAQAQGVSADTLDAAFSGVEINQRVLELDRRQPEFTRPIWEYLDKAVSLRRIGRGSLLLTQHGSLLREIGDRYGVDPQIIVAIWGLESDYGRAFGDFKVIEVLATLAYDGRRRDFGHEQLLAALKIIQRGDIDAAHMLGSWAGAMGHTQFIPTTFLDYAVDYDGDGRRDVWNSLPDVFASTAYYLSRVGNWQQGEAWGFEIRLPEGFNWDLSDPTIRKPLLEWRGYGIYLPDGSELPHSNALAEVLAPAGHLGPAFLVLNNFRAIMRYNNATSYALAVAHLSDRITGKTAIRAQWPRDLQPLSRTDKLDLQRLLRSRGYDPGGIDGIVGPRTRAAIKRFQRDNRLPNDGYPTQELLARLRGV